MNRWTSLVTAALALTPAFAATAQPVAYHNSGPAARADEVRTLAASLNHLAQEVTKLKQEVVQLKLEQYQLRIASLEKQLEQASAQRLAAETERGLLQEDLRELDEQLAQPADSESYAKLMEAKAKIATGRSAELDAAHRKSAEREAEVSKQLQLERQRLRQFSP